MNIKDEILETLGGFKYDPEVSKTFLSILAVRFDADSEIREQIKRFLELKKIGSQFFDIADKLFMTELKRLNLANLQARLVSLENSKMPSTVVIGYLKALAYEIKKDPLVPSSTLIGLEDALFKHLLDETHYNDELTELEGISKLNLRLVLQCWALYPELLHSPEQCHILLECLSVSNYRF